MSGTHTHTFVTLEVSKETFEEIAKKLITADYLHTFHETEGGRVIDMHGIGLVEAREGKMVIDDPIPEIEKGAGDDYPVIEVTPTPDRNSIFIDGGFDPNSYEERIKRSKGKGRKK